MVSFYFWLHALSSDFQNSLNSHKSIPGPDGECTMAWKDGNLMEKHPTMQSLPFVENWPHICLCALLAKFVMAKVERLHPYVSPSPKVLPKGSWMIYSTSIFLICVEFGFFLMESEPLFLNWDFMCRCSPYLRWIASCSTASTPTRSPWPCPHPSRLSGPPSCGCRNFISGWRKQLALLIGFHLDLTSNDTGKGFMSLIIGGYI